MALDPKMTEFYDYVLAFYGPNGIHPMGATLTQVKEATKTVKKNLKLEGEQFYGDSSDRELVRDIMMNKYKLILSRK
jgi:hypothetical protein